MDHPRRKGISIASVERETGLSKDTLRVWERRYRFPAPERNAAGERSYPLEQVDRLRLIKALIDRGHRPGKIVGADLETLRQLSARRPLATLDDSEDTAQRDDLAHYIALCKTHRIDELRDALNQSLLRQGMQRFITEIIAPLTAMVGAQWANGNLAVFEEHLYTECVQGVLRNAISTIPSRASSPAPRILLTTITHEIHGLGLLMAEAIFTLEGAHCISLGVQTPVADIALAATAQSADIVALSFSTIVRPAFVVQALEDLRSALPQQVEIWVGGHGAVSGRIPTGLARQLDLQDIAGAIPGWRERFAAS